MQSKRIWDARIVTYLFLAGMGAGAYGSTVLLNLLYASPVPPLRPFSAAAGIILVGTGTLFLLADLGHSSRFFRVFVNPTSVISYGAWILTGFLVIAFFDLVSPIVRNPVGDGLVVLLSLGVAVYTGFLLGVVNARPFWNTPLLPMLFLVSAFSTGIAAVNLLAMVVPGIDWVTFTAQLKGLKLFLIGIELLFLFTYLVIMYHSTDEAVRSVERILVGDLKYVFWFGVFGAGILLPLILLVVPIAQATVLIPAMSVMIGGFSIRHVILRAGGRVLLPGEDWRLGHS